ncbi:alpha/beta fold hydrolase [Streptomyces yaizuensis]|uniref:Prolyl oligopeptidase family serine peptidase n=1 Tax=Streptomyces yaizuensis TaxID=2989713 RepID=A0ABQ5P683_9ACTN|nr:alpha/beta fold hydrolase [Streptomyces sp. YSPA8]GLF98000.1 prolyl oligopeptidase family serine peptidase [Streptomyces sp. YSPA8]
MGLPRTALCTAVAGALSAALLAGPATAAPVGRPTTSAITPSAASSATSSGTSSAASGTTLRFTDIRGAGGTVLKANVTAPADTGRSYPLVVLPTSWAMPQIEYLAQARLLAADGYVVVGYNSRGFWQSGGEIEVAGPSDVADASRVIDWALANTPADPGRIGMAGVSYGAGISLLAAAEDPRIRAVVALSGWADLIDSIYSGRTQHRQAALVLTGAGFLTGRPSAELRRVMADFLGSDLSREGALIDWAKRRSAGERVARINSHGTAVMLGNAWGDSLFPPNQYADFFTRLTGPKRLEFRPGDHATPEAGGLFGLPNDTWAGARRWLDHHLRGVANGVDREHPVQLKARSGSGYEGYRDWASVTGARSVLPLAGSQRIRTGLDSGANGGTVFLSGLLDQFAQLPPLASIPLLPRAYAAVWQSQRYEEPRRIRGTARLETTVTATRSSGTFVAHLYDVGPLGLGRLVTSAPYSFHDRTPGTPFAVGLELFSTAYDVPAGHRLAVVIDTVDPLYNEHNPAGAQLTFSSPDGAPSRLSVPLREE